MQRILTLADVGSPMVHDWSPGPWNTPYGELLPFDRAAAARRHHDYGGQRNNRVVHRLVVTGKTLQRENFTVYINSDQTVGELKTYIEAANPNPVHFH